jgi:hypothetical protein
MFLKRLAVLLTIALTAAGGAFYVTSQQDDIGEMTIRPLGGTVFLVRDGRSIAVKGDTTLQAGDLITTDKAGSARLRLAGARSGELSDGAKVSVTDDASLEGRSGSMLMEVGDPTVVVFDGVRAESNHGAFRIDQGFGSSRVGAYDGKVSLSRPGQSTVTVQPLYEALLAAGDLPSRTKPYRAQVDDAWDREWLATELALDRELSELGGGLAAQLSKGTSRPNVQYFGGLAGRPAPFMKKHLRRPTAELLIGFTVGENARGLKLPAAVEQAFSLRDDGGQWGIVASILNSPPRPLLADLESVVLAAVGGEDGGATAPEFTLAAAAEATGEVPPPGETTDPGTTEPTDPDDPGDDPGDPDDPDEPDEPNDCSSGLDCDLDDLPVLGGGGGGGGGEPDPTPSPTDDPPLTKGLLDGGDGSGL